jgi:hypothetical protein
MVLACADWIIARPLGRGDDCGASQLDRYSTTFARRDGVQMWSNSGLGSDDVSALH